MIISTANETLKELNNLLGAPIYRRLSGENDDPSGDVVFNFYAAARKTLRVQSKEMKQAKAQGEPTGTPRGLPKNSIQGPRKKHMAPTTAPESSDSGMADTSTRVRARSPM